jgi:transcriptional regulator with XRE-family HTH domain
MRHVPQLKVLREEQGWSQRTLAARSGVAQNTISQLERGERKAMPSTVRKLADALGVDVPVLLADSAHIPVVQADAEIDMLIALATENLSRLRPEHREEVEQAVKEVERHRRRERDERKRAAAKRQTEREFFGFVEEPGDQDETGGWAEAFVSGNLVFVDDRFPEAHKAAILAHREGAFILYEVVPSLHSYPEDLVVARSRLEANDPNATLDAAQIVLGRAKKIVAECHRALQDFYSIPERYFADPTVGPRIETYQEALSDKRIAAAEAVRELMDLYDECLDTLEDQILVMRKESDELEGFVRQAPDQER